MKITLTPELEEFVKGKIEGGLFHDASEVIGESLRLLKEQDETSVRWREEIERGVLQAERGDLVDGDVAFDNLDERIKEHTRKRA